MPYGQPPSYDEKKPPPLVAVRQIPDGYAGTAAIIGEMRRLAREAYRDERVNRLAREVTINLPRRDYGGEAEAVLRWFQDTFRYTRLPWRPGGNFQRLQTPSETLFDAPRRTGECASLTVAMAAMLMSLGHEVAFRTAGSDANKPRDHEHVYLLVKIPDRGWVAADPSYEGPLGWEHGAAVVKEDWPV